MTRDKALKAITAFVENYACGSDLDGLRDAIEALKERPHGEWIPCSERLPEEDGKYMVCWCGDWGVDICFAIFSKCGKYWYARYGSEYRGITAWMPLPEPYKKEGEAE